MQNIRIPKAYELVVVLIAAATYLMGVVSPPALMDDVDAAEALQAKNMLVSGDWVTQRLNGTIYLDKAPFKYWVTASLYGIFGVHDWVARLPTALAAIALCWLVVRIGKWADSAEVGFYSGLVLATSIGLYLFTRTVIPDVILTLLITVCLWCFIRAQESENSSITWAIGSWGAMALAVLTKGLIGMFFPVAIAGCYLLLVRKSDWRRTHPMRGSLVLLAMVTPWHVLATIRNPPIFDWTLHAGPHFGGQFRGFFWFYFINEQLLRFLNERWPRDYNTVPRLVFWLYHLFWFFPWTMAILSIRKVTFDADSRSGRVRILLLCWISVVMLFFTFSTTQEYYSMPIYPAIVLLLGSALAMDRRWLKPAAGICVGIGGVLAFVLVAVWRLPAPGDIYVALAQHPDLYTLSLGHMADLTLPAFAYLKLPLGIAAAAFLAGGLLMKRGGYWAVSLMMVLFFQASRFALITFDPYLSSYAVAERLNHLPRGTLIVCGKYNPLSSLFFYFEDRAIQNEADLDILEYGSLAPDAPKITVSDNEMKRMWTGPGRVYIVAKVAKLRHLEEVLGDQDSHIAFRSGDKYLLVNQ